MKKVTLFVGLIIFGIFALSIKNINAKTNDNKNKNQSLEKSDYVDELLPTDPSPVFSKVKRIAQTDNNASTTTVSDTTSSDDTSVEETKIPEKAERYFTRARKRFSIGENQKALDDVNEALKIHPGYKEAIKLKGFINYRIGKYHVAIDIYKEYLTMSESPRSPTDMRDAHLSLCAVYLNMGVYGDENTPDTAVYHASLAKLINEETNDKKAEAKCHAWLGLIQRARGEYDLALLSYEKAANINEEIAERTTNNEGLAYSYNNLGFFNFVMGDYSDAQKRYEIALKKGIASDNRPILSTIYNNIGALHHRRGEYKKAYDNYRQSLAITEKAGDKLNSGINYSFLGELHREIGDYKKAQEFFTQARQNLEEIESKGKLVNLYQKIGDFFRVRGNIAEAQKQYSEANRLAREIGNKAFESEHQNNRGLLALDGGDYDLARKHFLLAFEIDSGRKKFENGEIQPASSGSKLKSNMAIRLNNMGLVYLCEDNYDMARKYFDRALDIDRGTLKSISETAVNFNNIGLTELGKESYQSALANFKNAERYNVKIGALRNLGFVQNNIGVLYSATGKSRNALEYYKKATRIFQKLGLKQPVAVAYNNMGHLYYKRKDYKNATKYFETALKFNRDVQHKLGTAISLNNLGLVEKETKKIESAERNIKEAIATFRELNLPVKQKVALDNESTIYIKDSDKGLDKLYNFFEERYRDAQENEIVANQVKYLAKMGDIQFRKKEYQKALDLYLQAMSLDEDNMYDFDWEAIAEIYEHQKKYDKAINNYIRSLKIHAKKKSRDGAKHQLRIALRLTNLYSNIKDKEAAFDAIRMAVELEYLLIKGRTSKTHVLVLLRYARLLGKEFNPNNYTKVIRGATQEFIATRGKAVDDRMDVPATPEPVIPEDEEMPAEDEYEGEDIPAEPSEEDIPSDEDDSYEDYPAESASIHDNPFDGGGA